MNQLSALSKLEATWEYSFPHDITRRGMSYSTQRRVVSYSIVQATDKTIELTGIVRGAKTYITNVFFHRKKDSFHIEATCSCPYEFDCKHAAALIYTFFKRDWKKQIEELGQQSVTASGKSRQEVQYKPISVALERALDRINLEPIEIAAPVMSMQYTIGYFFKSNAPIVPGRVISIKASLVAVSRDPRRPWAIEDQTDAVQQLIVTGGVTIEPDESDLGMRIGALCFPVERSYYNPDLSSISPRGEDILRAIRTGRAYLGRRDQPLKIGPEVPVEATWALSTTERLIPSIKGIPNSAAILPYKLPYLYYEPSEHVVGIMTTDSHIDLLAWMELSSVKREQGISLANCLQSRKLPVSGLEEFTAASHGFENCTPHPHVIIRQTGGKIPFYHYHDAFSFRDILRTGTSDFPLLCAELHFDYNGLEVPHSSLATTLKDPADPAKHYLRNFAFELATKERLRAMELVSLNQVPGTHTIPTKGLFGVREHSATASLTTWMKIVKTLSELERTAGWRVTLPPDVPLLAQEAEDWFGSFNAEEEGEGSHWFNGELGIIVNGEKRDLAPLLLTIIRDRPYYLAQLKASDSKEVVIQSDTMLVTLDRERLIRIVSTLTEFADEKHRDNKLRISLYSAQQLEQSLADTVAKWTTPAALTDLKRRIQLLTDIPPQNPTPEFHGTLREYQTSGVNWLCAISNAALGGILADDMGLGKTVQLISFLLHEREQGRDGPSLVVCPKSIAPNWAAEIARFAPKLRVYRATGTDRAKSPESIPECNILLTTYPLLARDAKLLQALDFNVAIFDEAQYIKNPQTLAYQAALNLRARLRLPVSGTPIENNLDELWAHFNMTIPGYLGSRSSFRQHYRKPIEKDGDDLARQVLAKRIKPFIMRRLKQEVAKDLPPVTEIMHRCELDSGQRDLYETIRKLTDKKIRQALQEKGAARSHIEFLDALLKLRQVCCDPRLVKSTAARKVKESAKLTSLSELLGILMGDNLSVIVFSQFTSMLDLIEDEVKKQAIPYAVLTGQTDDRETPLHAFQTKQVPLLLMSLKAGGVGLNLCTADAVILYDPWWNPAVEEQAISRAHRIGRTQPVLVYRLIADKTIEEKILDLHARKKSLSSNLLPQDGDIPQLTEELVDYLFA